MSKILPQGFRFKKEEIVTVSFKIKKETLEDLEAFEEFVEKEDPTISINRNDIVEAGLIEFINEGKKAFDKHKEKIKERKPSTKATGTDG